MSKNVTRLRRALFTASDKTGILELAQEMVKTGCEIVATGKTAQILIQGGVTVVPIENITKSPEAFQGRMKTLSYQVSAGILYRRGDATDEADAARLGILPIDAVVVNFYPFEEASKKAGLTESELIEEIDIGGPTLVRAAAKNAPHVVVLTHSNQYDRVISDLREYGGVRHEVAKTFANEAWKRVSHYDRVIDEVMNQKQDRLTLRYGENPHQTAFLDLSSSETGLDLGPLDWKLSPTKAELSYNNILDVSSAYALMSDLRRLSPEAQAVVIVKHNNACGVALGMGVSQLEVLNAAWDGDPVSAFGGVLLFSHPLERESAEWLAPRFIECVGAPLIETGSALSILTAKRKNLKAVSIRRYCEEPEMTEVRVPGGRLVQTVDSGRNLVCEPLRGVTQREWPTSKNALAWFGIQVCKSLKSNAIALVREFSLGGGKIFQLVGAGQGQPNRIDALQILAVPRAEQLLARSEGPKTEKRDLVLVSDAFFPFRDSIDAVGEAGIEWVIQPGGSMKDEEVIRACNEKNISMAFTGMRHFKH